MFDEEYSDAKCTNDFAKWAEQVHGVLVHSKITYLLLSLITIERETEKIIEKNEMNCKNVQDNCHVILKTSES